MPALRVLVVAADPLARGGIAALLATQPSVVVAGVADPADATRDTLDAFRPEAVLWDVGASPMSTERLAAALESGAPAVVALVADATGAARAWAAGARGVLRRDAPAARVAAALHALASGVAVLDPAFADILVTPHAVQEGLAPPTEPLTPREMDVLRLLAEGLPNKAIADRLGVTEHAVKFHVNNILGKLSAQGRTEAVTRAMRLGLITV